MPFEAFRAALHSAPLHVLLGCESWKVCACRRNYTQFSCQQIVAHVSVACC